MKYRFLYFVVYPHGLKRLISWRRIIHVFICLFLLSFVSCVTTSELATSSIPAQTLGKIIETLRERETNVTSLKGLFQAEVDGKGMVFTQSLQGSIFYQHPNQYRIQGFTRLGGLIFDFVLSGDFYALRVGEHPRPIIGGMDNFQKLGEFRLPVLLSLRAIEVVLGKLSFDTEGIIAAQVYDTSYQFDIPQDSKILGATLYQRIVVDQISLQVRQLDYLSAEGKAMVSIYTSDFRQVRDGGSSELRRLDLPFGVRVEDRVEAGSIALEFHEIKANELLEKKMFTLTAF